MNTGGITVPSKFPVKDNLPSGTSTRVESINTLSPDTLALKLPESTDTL